MAIKWHLAGFYFISAADIEGRVIPQLSQSLFRQQCDEAKHRSQHERLQACCPHFNASDPENPACLQPEPMDSLRAYCKHLYPDESSTDFKECLKIASPKEYMMFKNARKNWIRSMNRNYVSGTIHMAPLSVMLFVYDISPANQDLLQAVEEANKDPDPAGQFRRLCSGRSCNGNFCDWRSVDGQKVASRTICPWDKLAPGSLISEAKDLQGKKIQKKQQAEYEAYNVIGFGGGGGALEYSALMKDHFAPGICSTSRAA